MSKNAYNESIPSSLALAQQADYSRPGNNYFHPGVSTDGEYDVFSVYSMQNLFYSICPYPPARPALWYDWIIHMPSMVRGKIRRLLNKPLPLTIGDVCLGVKARYGDEKVRGITCGVTHPCWPEIMEVRQDEGVDDKHEYRCQAHQDFHYTLSYIRDEPWFTPLCWSVGLYVLSLVLLAFSVFCARM